MIRHLCLCLPALLAGVTPAAGADFERGRLIAHGGGPAGATACFRCHGLDGMGDAALAAPRLAGLPEFYLGKQMRDFARGTRPDPVMSPIAEALDDDGRHAVAAYYAAMPIAAVAAGEGPEAGRRIALEGLPGRGVPACAACHGHGIANPAPALPSLAGQPAGYIVLQLGHWRGGGRNNDPLGGMERFAARLRPEEIEAVAAWYAAQGGGP